ncbi:MAG TPA: hypothetical protein VGI87_17465 [Solirubrobacteraceae bacterium]
MTLPCDSSAPATARGAVRELEAAQTLPEDAVLIASELVSSEVLEGRSSASDTIDLVASNIPDGVRITVESGPEAGLPTPTPMILRVVRGLARRWGISHLNGRPELWAELAY